MAWSPIQMPHIKYSGASCFAGHRLVMNLLTGMFSQSTYEQGSSETQTLPSTPTQPHNLNVFCTLCRAHLGFFNFRTSAVTLLKWQISCPSTSGIVPTIPECLAATLISTMARSGSSKSLITPLGETISQESGQQQNAIQIWALNSSIVYSSSCGGDDAQPTPAVKLLYRSIPNEEADKMLETISCDSQEINLPAQAIGEVVRHLDGSNVLLPPTERLFKEWKRIRAMPQQQVYNCQDAPPADTLEFDERRDAVAEGVARVAGREGPIFGNKREGRGWVDQIGHGEVQDVLDEFLFLSRLLWLVPVGGPVGSRGDRPGDGRAGLLRSVLQAVLDDRNDTPLLVCSATIYVYAAQELIDVRPVLEEAEDCLGWAGIHAG
ncbi:hypothetical protein N0V88_006628 [Collariella sp. IMI 366227]|nr:hypothetical protein N0V88_006628 [Collariella sp. IMI 366227]